MDEEAPSNPIVAAAMRIRARRDLGALIDSSGAESAQQFEDAPQALAAFGDELAAGIKRLNAILGKAGVKYIRLERPLRLRLRFADRRVRLDLDEVHQLVRVAGEGLEGEYQFDPSATRPSLINLSKISTEAGYGERLTAAGLLKIIAQDAELPRPEHLDRPGPLSF